MGAATAGEAMTLAATEHFDAVVLDVELPDGSGPELVRRMRAIPSLSSAKFVGMSSYESNEIGNRFDAFLPKPFHPKRLASLSAQGHPGQARARRRHRRLKSQ